MNSYTQTRKQTSLVSSVKFWVMTLILALIYSAFIFAQNVVYIDPTNSGDPGQNGSVDHPYDKWNDFTIQSNTTYLQKKGTTYTVPAYSGAVITANNLDNVVIGTYGTGSKPIIQDPNGQVDRLVDIRLTQGFTIDGFDLIGAPGVNGTGVGIQLQGSTNPSQRPCKNIHIYNCDIHSVGTGTWYIPYETPTSNMAVDFQLVNCNIYDLQDDGVFWVEVRNIRIEGCHIYNVAQHVGNGGDGIHIVEQCENYLIKDNIVDRRGSVDKFCFISGCAAGCGTAWGTISGNTFYSPDDDPNWGGAALYIGANRKCKIEYNKFLGGGQAPIHAIYNDTITLKYNLFHNMPGDGVIQGDGLIDISNNTVVSNKTGYSFLFSVGGDGVCRFWNNIVASNNLPLDAFHFAYGNWNSHNNLIQTSNPNNWNNYFGFVNWLNMDYHLTTTSIAKNTGYQYNGYNLDIDGVIVPQEVIRDIGACEYTDGAPNTNNPPVIANQSFSVNENSANGTQVGTVVATDPDAGQTLTYSIINGNTNNAFQINVATGAISVNNSSALNYEITPSFALTVSAQDNGQGNLSSQATITINLNNVNENPNISNQTFSIAENSPNATQVGVVVATDPDAGQTLTYSIINGNTNNAFQINASTGALSVANSSALNFEVVTSFGLMVRAEDNGQGNLYSQAIITVNLTNVNENPNISNQTFSIAENSPNATQVGVVVATDPDAGQTLAYSIISGNTNNAFQINATTGSLSVNNSSALNFEVIASFGLTVRAQDNGQGSLYSQATITVNITNVNENPNISNQTFSIAENSPNTTQVGAIVATDPDAGQILTYSIVSGNTNNAFQINASTGVMTVNNSSVLNFEVIASFSLTVKAQDNGQGNLYSQAIITVNLTDVNENPNISNQTFSIAENSPNGNQAGVVVASDPDAGQTLVYSIISGNTNNAFQINSSTGALTVNNSSALNFEVLASFSLTVKVSDNGAGNLFSQATITVNLTDVNENPSISNQTFSIAENSPNGNQAGIVVASDPDAGQTLVYSIVSGNTNNAFQINATSGVLTVSNSTALNYEAITTFSLTIKAQDNGQGNLFSQATITVNITDVNESPVITNQTFAVPENSPNGFLVGNLIASDPDNGQILTYSILSGNTDNAFTLNAATGVLTVSNSNAINSTINPVFNLIVEVTDNGSGNLSSQANVTVYVTDTNQPPLISNQNFSIPENSANGALVGTVIATDPDAGQTLTYSIISGNTGNAFQINSTSGSLVVNNSMVLDFETNPGFNLVVKVQDDGPGTLSSQANISVNLTNVNETPVIANQTYSIPENSQVGQQVGVVVACDPDAGQTLTYSIVSGNTSNAFQINASSGALSVNNSMALNFEVNPVFSLIVKVQDNGQGNLFAQSTVTVNLTDMNENPVISNQSFSIPENSQVGQQVGLVVASDPDAGQTLTYSIVSGNTSNAFHINALSGALSVNNSMALNFEVNPVFSLIVKVQDNGQGNLFAQSTVTVNLTDMNENPVISNQSFSIPENSQVGQQVGVVVASDPDAGQTLTYSIVSGNTNNAFHINALSGALSVNNSMALNFEVNPVFSLIVKVQDNGQVNLFAQSTVTVNLTDINENPVISNQVFNLTENSPNGQQIGAVVATDPDAGQTLTYSIIDGNTDDAFVINSASGVLTVNNSSAINYEVIATFELTVKVQDNGPGNLESEATITVNLIDENEPPQIEDQAFYVAEFTPNGQIVATVVANDPDNGQSLTYTITEGNTDNAFLINPSTGAITVNNSDALNIANNPFFYLTVLVEDDGLGNLTNQGLITMTLTDVNQQPIIADQTFEIEENSSNGQLVGTVIATDPDAGQTITYSIIGGNLGLAFQINSSTGALTVNDSNSMNFEILPSFSLIIKVEDDGIGNMSAQAIITVNLLDINETPQIDDQVFAIDEFSANGTEVGTIIATDPDNGQTLTYSILSGNIDNAFLLNPETGVLTVLDYTVLDFDVNPVFDLIVEVNDDGSGNLSDLATITVNLNNLTVANEIMPVVTTCQLYPNPAVTYIDLKIVNLYEEVWITLLNLSGETLWREKSEGENGTLIKRLDIGGLSTGMYIIKINNGTILFQEKFIKQ